MQGIRKGLLGEWINEWMNFLVELVSMFPGTSGKKVSPLIHCCKSLDSTLQCTEHFRPALFFMDTPSPPRPPPGPLWSLWGKCHPAPLFGWRVLGTFKAMHSGSSWIETKYPFLKILPSVSKLYHQPCLLKRWATLLKCRAYHYITISIQRKYLGRNRITQSSFWENPSENLHLNMIEKGRVLEQILLKNCGISTG